MIPLNEGPDTPFPEPVLSPGGRLFLDPSDASDVPAAASATRRLRRVWAEDSTAGLLELADPAWSGAPSPILRFWRDFARLFLTALCHTPGWETDVSAQVQEPAPDELRALIDRVPPMKGQEYLSPEVLLRLWRDLDARARLEAAACEGGITAWLKTRDPNWRLVGRVTFHLAENKRDPSFPFVGGREKGTDSVHAGVGWLRP